MPTPKTTDDKPFELPETPETDAPEEEFIEGGLPGMPAVPDPLREPGPVPSQREVPPLD